MLTNKFQFDFKLINTVNLCCREISELGKKKHDMWRIYPLLRKVRCSVDDHWKVPGHNN